MASAEAMAALAADSIPQPPKVATAATSIGTAPLKEKRGVSKLVPPGSFDRRERLYPRVQNAVIHPTVAAFFALGRERIVKRYCHQHPDVPPDVLREVLSYAPTYFRWAGADTFSVTSGDGRKLAVVIETNSCPSGMKSMPSPPTYGGDGGDSYAGRDDDQGGYRRLLTTTFRELLSGDGGAPPPPRVAPPAAAGGATRHRAESGGSASTVSIASAPVVAAGGPLPAGAAAASPSSGRSGAASVVAAAPPLAAPAVTPLPLDVAAAAAAALEVAGDAPPDAPARAAAAASPRAASSGCAACGAADSGASRRASPANGIASSSSSVAAAVLPAFGGAVPPAGGSGAAPSPPLTGRSGASSAGARHRRRYGDPAAGALAVVFDKNPMEAGGYAAALADAAGEDVLLVEFFLTDPDPPVRFDADRRMHVRRPSGEWTPVRGAFRYVTQRPWTRLPVTCATPMLNPILPCLAGGRNKAMAARAYDALNADFARRGWPASLRVRVPETIRGVRKGDVPALVRRFGGRAVVKVPYGNAGQGVYTILSPGELDAFMAEPHRYDAFIVQALVGAPSWSSTTAAPAGGDGGSDAAPRAPLYHVGTVPNARGEVFVADVRVMVSYSAEAGGFQPLALYARRAREPLRDDLGAAGGGADGAAPLFSWGMLGTNLSVSTGELTWSSEAERLLLMDGRDFNVLGLGLDELLDAYVQTVLAVTAVDRMCAALVDGDGRFDLARFAQWNDDAALLAEVLV